MSSQDYGSYDVMLRGTQHSNPMFDYMTTFIPRKLKSFFLYCEYLYHYCGAVTAVVNKLAFYPVTTLRFDTDNEKNKEAHTELHETTLNTRVHLIQAAINRNVYGNAFVSIHFPFQRQLQCPKCKTRLNTSKLEEKDVKYEWKAVEFRGKCSCKYEGAFDIKDEPLNDKDKIHIIHWDPKHMDIVDNPITGESDYYYEIPGDLSARLREGDLFLAKTLPLSFLKTIAQQKENNNDKALYKFDRDAIFHLRTTAPAGTDKAWGFPPIASAIKGFFHMAMLRKANEAIAMDFVVPLRIGSPKQSTGSNDPTMKLNLANWVTNMEEAVKNWRRDQLHIAFSPVPIDVTHVGGQGRALMVTGEITQTENEILAALGVPREFVYGGLTSTGGGVTLRMIENQLMGIGKELTKLAQWIDTQCSIKLSLKRVRVRLEAPKLLDDLEQKMLVMKANDALGGTMLAPQTIAELFDRDLLKERKLRIQNMLDENKAMMEAQNEINRQQQSLSQQATDAALGAGLNYNPQAVTAQAQQIAMQMMQQPENLRRSQLDQLNKEDAVMYACVIQQLEVLQNEQRMQAQMMVQQQGGGM